MFSRRLVSVKSQDPSDDFLEKRHKELGDLYLRGIQSFAVPNHLTTDNSFKKYLKKSQKQTRNQREKSLFDERNNVVIPLGTYNDCVVIRVYKQGKKAFHRLRTEYFTCSKDTYAVDTCFFVDYYYDTSHVPFVIPTCHEFFGASISLLAQNSFVLAASSLDVEPCCSNDDDSRGCEYEVLNDKEIMRLPKILEKAIREKFNLTPSF